MMSLIRLEYKKAKLKTFLLLSVAAIPILIYWCVFNAGGHSNGYQNYQEAFADVYFYVNATYLIFHAVLIAKIVLEEYRTNTITLLFSYPHPRSKLILAKLIFMSSYIFIFTIVSSLFIIAVVVLHNFYTHTIPNDGASAILTVWYHALLFALGSIGIGLISYFFGMLRKSIPAAIIPPFLLTAASSEFYYGGSFITIIGASFGCLLLGVVLSYISIKKEMKSDIH